MIRTFLIFGALGDLTADIPGSLPIIKRGWYSARLLSAGISPILYCVIGLITCHVANAENLQMRQTLPLLTAGRPHWASDFTMAPALVVLPLTYCTVVVGELLPKTLALKHALGFALNAAPWLSFSDKILGPLVTLLEWSTKRLLRLLSFWPKRRGNVEVKEPDEDLVELSSLSSQHRQYVLNLVDLERKRVKDMWLNCR